MKDDKGKVIFSLLAGATAGIVAGLLLAPETGDDARANLKRSASKWGDGLGKFFKDTLAKAQGQELGHVNTDASLSEDKHAADRLLANLDSGGNYPDADTDYDGSGDDFRHQPIH